MGGVSHTHDADCDTGCRVLFAPSHVQQCVDDRPLHQKTHVRWYQYTPMQRASLASLVLVVFVMVAGCNAFNGGSEMPRVAPKDVPTAEPTQTPVSRLAPGLTLYGVVDPHALSQAHDAALNNTSYTYLESVTKEYINGTLRARQTVTTRVVDPIGRFYTIVTKDLPRVPSPATHLRFEYWSDGTGMLVARTVGSNTTYQKFPANRANVEISNSKQLSTLFQAIDTRVVNRTTRNGTTLYRLEATQITDPIALFELTNIFTTPKTATMYENQRNVTFYALIDSHGLVHEYRLAYTKTLVTNGRNVTIRTIISIRHTNVGSTTVERPSWYGTVMNQSQTNRTTAEASPGPFAPVSVSSLGVVIKITQHN